MALYASAIRMARKYPPSTSSAYGAVMCQTLPLKDSAIGTYPVDFPLPARFGPRVAMISARQGE